MSRGLSVSRRSRWPVCVEKTAIPGAAGSVDLATNVAGYAAVRAGVVRLAVAVARAAAVA